MKEPRPQDYDPTYKQTVQAETFDVSDLTPIATKQPPAENKTKKTTSLPASKKASNKKQVARPKRSTTKAKKSFAPNVRPERVERPERVSPQNSKASPSPTLSEPDGKREIKRHSFEFYRDQLPKLKQLKAEFMMRGSDKSMSAMVREAVDKYIENYTT